MKSMGMWMWSGRLALLGLALAAVAACGGTLREVQGAQFDLNGQENSLADQYTQADPVQADPASRCQYWSRRSAEAGQGHAMGMLVWQPTHFVTLHAWAQAKRAEACSQHHKRERQGDGAIATAGINNGSVVAIFTGKAKCRDTVVDVRGLPFAAQQNWSPCPGAPLAGALVRLVLADGQVVSATTDARGRVQFSLAGIRWTDDALRSGQAEVALATDPPLASFPITALPQYGDWQKRKDAEAKFARDSKALDDFEGAVTIYFQLLTTLEHAKDPWGDDQIAQSKRLVNVWHDAERANQVLQADRPVDERFNPRLEALNARVNTIPKRVQALQPHVDRLVALRKRQDDLTWSAILAALQSQSSGRGGGGWGGGGSPQPTAAPSGGRTNYACLDHCHQGHNSCQNACQFSNDVVDGRHPNEGACLDMCTSNEETCKAGCEK